MNTLCKAFCNILWTQLASASSCLSVAISFDYTIKFAQSYFCRTLAIRNAVSFVLDFTLIYVYGCMHKIIRHILVEQVGFFIQY